MRVLIAEDNQLCRELLQEAIESLGWEVVHADSGTRALAVLEAEQPDILLLDINLPEKDGFEVLQHARRIAPQTKVIVISGSIGVLETVRALKLGACDALPKPFDINILVETLKRIAVVSASECEGGVNDGEMTVVSRPMREVSRRLRTIAKSRTTTVLITGETGSGKEVVAMRLHRTSEASDKPFIAVNCSAIPPSLVESELFGHEKGAFTDARATRKGYFEAAEDGTIFLDEIGDLSLDLQSKLLRVLQERTFRRVGGTQELPLQARVITATNVDLAAAVRAGRFREDLYYRLAVMPIHLLPLRQRPEDIVPLAETFLAQFVKEMKCQIPMLTEEHKSMLNNHTWPGNVRELKNVMERFVLMEGRLEFVPSTRDFKAPEGGNLPSLTPAVQTQSVEESERKMIYSLLLKRFLSEQQTEHARSPVVLS